MLSAVRTTRRKCGESCVPSIWIIPRPISPSVLPTTPSRFSTEAESWPKGVGGQGWSKRNRQRRERRLLLEKASGVRSHRSKPTCRSPTPRGRDKKLVGYLPTETGSTETQES